MYPHTYTVVSLLLSPHPRKCLFPSKLNPRNTEPKSILVGLVLRETLLLADA